MARSTWHQRICQLSRHLRHTDAVRQHRPSCAFERLGERITPAVNAFFSPSAGLLTVMGDNLDNPIEISRDLAGTIMVNGGAVQVVGGTPTVSNTAQIQLFGLGGHDQLSLSEVNGALPKAHIYGGAGNDTIIGGSAADLLFGQSGDDTLLGMGGSDFLFGGADNDTLIGGDANDLVFGELGDDLLIWNPGDDTDLNEGGGGNDTIEVNGGGGAEVFTTLANGTRVRFDRIDPAPFSLDIGTSEHLVLNANGGNDSFSATGNLAALIQITVDGGQGDDTILGSNGADVLLGGDGNDFIDGQQGNDVVLLGVGDDTFQWDPGDASDTVKGEDGIDTMVFNGSAGNEIFNVSANGAGVRLTRNLGNIVMDLDGVENIDLNTLGGADTTTLFDLSATDVLEVNVNLAGTIGGSAGDAAADVVIVNGTNGDDIVDVFGSGTSVSVLGLSATLNVLNSEGANDSFVINALDGDDGVTATTLPAGVIKLTLDGGAGDDTLLGSQGADVFLGGSDHDFIFGDNGNDLALMGSGDDLFQWDPGDGSDIVEGQGGIDGLLFFGSGASENLDINANGGRVMLLRDVGSVTMDLDDVEKIDVVTLGGSDNIVVGDMSGTDLVETLLDLRGVGIGGDGTSDSITVNATNGDDAFGVTGDAGGMNVFGLTNKVTIVNQEVANDRLTLNALGGTDVVDATSLEADAIQLTLIGGLGDDILIGGEGDDLLNGGDGNDLALMGAGDDTFVWNPGDDNDTLEGQGGFDKMLFNGSNAAENISISANAGRVLFFRNVASVTMDLDDVERIDFNGLGGVDNVTVGDLTATDVVEVNIALAASSGGGDAQIDQVIVNGTSNDDAITVVGDANSIAVIGLAARVNITGAEPANDRLTINAHAGDDAIDASALLAVIGFIAHGGNDDDTLVGSEGADVLTGGDGDDVLLGGPGIDILDGGPGANIVIQ